MRAGARLLRDVMRRYVKDLTLVAAAYNAGIGALARYGGVPPYAETQAYVAKVLALHGRYRGQRQKWIAMRFTGEDGDINVATPEPEFAQWKWLAIEALPRLIVPFKRDTYTRVIGEFRDLAFVA